MTIPQCFQDYVANAITEALDGLDLTGGGGCGCTIESLLDDANVAGLLNWDGTTLTGQNPILCGTGNEPAPGYPAITVNGATGEAFHNCNGSWQSFAYESLADDECLDFEGLSCDPNDDQAQSEFHPINFNDYVITAASVTVVTPIAEDMVFQVQCRDDASGVITVLGTVTLPAGAYRVSAPVAGTCPQGTSSLGVVRTSTHPAGTDTDGYNVQVCYRENF